MRIRSITAFTLAGLLAACNLAVAGEGDVWNHVAEFSLVATGGNSEVTTLGFKDTSTREWEKALLTIKFGAIDSESKTTTRVANGVPAAGVAPAVFFVSETSKTENNAEAYFLNGKYDQNITDRLFWFASLGWDRNRPTGIENRYSAAGGVGNIWYDNDTMKWRTSYSVTYTHQEDVIKNPMINEGFFGLRGESNYTHQFNESTGLGHDVVLDVNLDETSDWRAFMDTYVNVNMNKSMALKAGLVLLYDNEPALNQVPLFPLGGGAQTGFVTVANESLDTIFTTSLVINF